MLLSRVLVEQCCKLTLLRLLYEPAPSEAVLPEQVGLPQVLPLWEAVGNLDLAEVLDAFLQFLLHRHLLLDGRTLLVAGVSGAGGQRAQQVALPALLRPLLLLLLLRHRAALLGGPVQCLDHTAADGAADYSAQWRACLRLAVGAGGGEVVEGGDALAVTLLAAAVAWRRGPARRSACRWEERRASQSDGNKEQSGTRMNKSSRSPHYTY